MGLKVIIKRPGEKVGHYEDIENSLEALQKIVGGYIETHRIRNDTVMIMNEEGKLDGLEPNVQIGEIDTVCGPLILCGFKGEEFTHVPVGMDEWEVILRWWGNKTN